MGTMNNELGIRGNRNGTLVLVNGNPVALAHQALSFPAILAVPMAGRISMVLPGRILRPKVKARN